MTRKQAERQWSEAVDALSTLTAARLGDHDSETDWRLAAAALRQVQRAREALRVMSVPSQPWEVW
jgi:hypothetical protein